MNDNKQTVFSESGKETQAIVIRDVADVRGIPSEKGELTTQVLMGTIVKVSNVKSGYYYIRMPDGYLGWIRYADIIIADSAELRDWNNAKKVIVTDLDCSAYTKPDTSSEVSFSAVAGCILKCDTVADSWTEVELANKKSGFIHNSSIQNLGDWQKSRHLSGENLEETAMRLLGIPYLWGGTSVRGMDCSGFVKTVYRLNGMELQRDAYQQAEQGIHIDPGKDFENLRKGDLIFFREKIKKNRRERVTHVGIYLGNKLFIHSSGNVHYGSFDPESQYYDKELLGRFIRARRLF